VYPPHTSEKRSVCGYIYYSCVSVIKFLDLKGKVAVKQNPRANFKTKRMRRVFCFNENGRLIDRQQVICVQFKALVLMDKGRNHGDLIIALSTACSRNFQLFVPSSFIWSFLYYFSFLPYILNVQFLIFTRSNIPKTWGENYKLQPS
jgi:hypothetical protein